MSKKTLLTMIFGLILILTLSFFSANFGLKQLDEGLSIKLDEENFSKNFDVSYDTVLDKIGGGSFKNDDINVFFDKNWILNKANPGKNNVINNNGTVFFNAYLINEESSTPWIYAITKNDSFETTDYAQKIKESKGEIVEKKEDGSFIIEFDNGTNKKTIIMQKVVKTNDHKFITISLTTVNAPIQKVKETFDYLLNNTTILNYSETVFFNEDNIIENEADELRSEDNLK